MPFSLNHIVAVIIPVLFGVLWIHSPAFVFYIGAVMASIALLLAFTFNVPNAPDIGNEVVVGRLGDHASEAKA